MYVTTSKPCPEQEEIMKSLGFELSLTRAINCSNWIYNIEDGISVALELCNDEVPSYKNIVNRVIWTAFRIGEEQKRKDIVESLGLNGW